jgi:hypothetical protein
MRDAQRDGTCDGNETEMGGLHPKGEPYTFYSSHRCLLTRRLGQGRVRCFSTSASRYISLLLAGLLRTFLLVP